MQQERVSYNSKGKGKMLRPQNRGSRRVHKVPLKVVLLMSSRQILQFNTYNLARNLGSGCGDLPSEYESRQKGWKRQQCTRRC